MSRLYDGTISCHRFFFVKQQLFSMLCLCEIEIQLPINKISLCIIVLGVYNSSNADLKILRYQTFIWQLQSILFIQYTYLIRRKWDFLLNDITNVYQNFVIELINSKFKSSKPGDETPLSSYADEPWSNFHIWITFVWPFRLFCNCHSCREFLWKESLIVCGACHMDPAAKGGTSFISNVMILCTLV